MLHLHPPLKNYQVYIPLFLGNYQVRPAALSICLYICVWSEFMFSLTNIYFFVSNIYPSTDGWTGSVTLPQWKHFSVFCSIVTHSKNNISLQTLDEYNFRMAYCVSTCCFRFQSRIVCSFQERWTKGRPWLDSILFSL